MSLAATPSDTQGGRVRCHRLARDLTPPPLQVSVVLREEGVVQAVPASGIQRSWHLNVPARLSSRSPLCLGSGHPRASTGPFQT